MERCKGGTTNFDLITLLAIRTLPPVIISGCAKIFRFYHTLVDRFIFNSKMQIVAGCKELYNASLHNGLPPKPGPVFSKVTILTKKK